MNLMSCLLLRISDMFYIKQGQVFDLCLLRPSYSQMFLKIGVLKTFANFIGKHLCWRLFLTKLQTWNFI